MSRSVSGWMVNCKGFGRRWLRAHQHYILVLAWRDMKSMHKVMVADGWPGQDWTQAFPEYECTVALLQQII